MLARRDLQLRRLRVSCLEHEIAQPGRPSLVLLHGLMGTAATYTQFMESLPPDRHVVALDFPGAGRSERGPSVSATLSAASGCVGEVLSAMRLDRPVLVGHSHGGAVALHRAALEPQSLGGVVLLAPAHPYSRQADPIIRFYLSPLGAAFAYTLPWYPQWLQLMGLRQMAGPQSWDTPERLLPYRENLRTRGTVPHLLRLLQTWHSDMHELQCLLEAPLELPVLLIWGDHDRAVPLSTAPALQQRLRRSELQVMPGVGHRPAEERAELCATRIEDWCEQLSGPGRRGPTSTAA